MAFNGVITEKLPANPPYGLLSVADVVEHGSRDDHWIGGFYVESDACTGETSMVVLCGDPGETEVVTQDGVPYFKVAPFGIIERLKCENSAGMFARDGRKRVLDKLESVTEYTTEYELWNGVSAVADTDPLATADRYLRNAVVVDATPRKASVAVGLVERAFSAQNPGIPATIHLSAVIADALRSTLREKDGKLYTKAGSLVTVNRAMTYTVNPVGNASTLTIVQDWVYATGPVHVHLGSEELITVSNEQVVDAKTNATAFVAERPAAVYFEGCSAYAAAADATL